SGSILNVTEWTQSSGASICPSLATRIMSSLVSAGLTTLIFMGLCKIHSMISTVCILFISSTKIAESSVH
ncbi:hypothetical protein PENTCL1PPCAC_12682, partial [Pristionchus entomophagus]